MVTKYVVEGKTIKLRPLVSHVIAVGKSGSGKSNACETYITSVYEAHNESNNSNKRYKIFDIFDNGRLENAMYSYQEDDPYLIKRMDLLGRKPRSYPSDYYVIYGNNLKFKNKLPSNFKLASFDLETLKLHDIFYLFATTEPSKAL